MSRPWAGVSPAERHRVGPFVGYAAAGVVAYTTATPLLSLFRIAAWPIDPGRVAYAAAAIACLLTAAEELHERLPECRTLVLTGFSQPRRAPGLPG